MPRLRLPLAALCLVVAAPALAAPTAPPPRVVQAAAGRTGALLVVTLCAEDAPTVCDIERTPLYDAPILCLAPPQLAQFARPGWRIARWRCERD